MLTPLLLEPALVLAGALGGPPPAAPETLALRAAHVHVGDGTVLEDTVVVLEGGKIARVGGDAPSGVRVIEVDGHLSPGLIALRDGTGAGSERTESTRKLTPTVDLARAFDPEHPDWARLVREGITTVVLTPGSSRVAGGVGAIVSPALGEVVKPGALVCLGASSRSLSTNEEPTSYAGLYAHLGRAFSEAADGSPLARAKAGSLPVMMEVVERSEAMLAVEFAKEHGLVGALVGLRRADGAVEAIAASGLGVVFEPAGVGASRTTLMSARLLHEAGVPIAFTADAESRGAAALRMAAAAYVRAGLGSEAALQAMTHGAAEIAGVSGSHGTIAAGKVAELVVWSGAPTDLTSRVLHVFAGGEHVYDAQAHGGQEAR